MYMSMLIHPLSLGEDYREMLILNHEINVKNVTIYSFCLRECLFNMHLKKYL